MDVSLSIIRISILITSHATDGHPKEVQIPHFRWLFRFLACAETPPCSLSALAKYSVLWHPQKRIDYLRKICHQFQESRPTAI